MSGLKIHPTMRLGHEDIETIIRSQFNVNIDDDNIQSSQYTFLPHYYMMEEVLSE